MKKIILLVVLFLLTLVVLSLDHIFVESTKTVGVLDFHLFGMLNKFSVAKVSLHLLILVNLVFPFFLFLFSLIAKPVSEKRYNRKYVVVGTLNFFLTILSFFVNDSRYGIY